MSRIGKKMITLPAGVTAAVVNGKITVRGPKGELSLDLPPTIRVASQENRMTLEWSGGSDRSRHGLYRSLVSNMVSGVSEGFGRELELTGTGYRAKMNGSQLVLTVGFSHDVKIDPRPGITFAVEGDNLVKVSGIDKNLVGQTAANIRAVRPPDHYKGKGIRYRGEKIKLKPGKQMKSTAA